MCEFLRSPENDADKQEIQRLQNRVAAEALVSAYLYAMLNDSTNRESRQIPLDAAEMWQMLLEARETNDYSTLLRHGYGHNVA